MWLKDILGGFGMKRFFVWFVLVLIFFSIPGSADNVDISSMTFKELVDLRDCINTRLQTLYPDYDYILTSGDYFVGIDIPEGKAMLYRLNTENDKYDILHMYDEKNEEIFFDGLSDEHPRLKTELVYDSKLEVRRGPIGLKYLND